MQNNNQKMTLRKKLRRKFFPTPTELVDGVNSKNYYPSGRAYWNIAPKIVKSKAIGPKEKMELLFDYYGKYYIYQQEKTVSFAVYENYYEEFITEGPNRTVHKNQGRYEKLFNEMLSENSYIVNRDLREQAEQIMQQAEKEGTSKLDFVESLDEKTRSIIYLSQGLQDDYHDKLVFNVYCSTKEEGYIQDLLRQRFFENHPDHLDEQLKTEPFPEFFTGAKNPRPIPAHIPAPTALEEVLNTIKDAPTQSTPVDSKKLPEQ